MTRAIVGLPINGEAPKLMVSILVVAIIGWLVGTTIYGQTHIPCMHAYPNFHGKCTPNRGKTQFNESLGYNPTTKDGIIGNKSWLVHTGKRNYPSPATGVFNQGGHLK